LNPESLKYKLALSFIHGVGTQTAKNLIAYIGNIEGIFKEKKTTLTKIQGIGTVLAENILKADNLSKADAELEFIHKHGISVKFYLDSDYPNRLKQCTDAPIILYSLGDIDLDHSKIISIVGTRNSTQYGKEICTQLLSDLSDRGHDAIIVSGLAHGVDSYAHKEALKNNLKTAAVLGHGFNTIYPAANRSLATSIKKDGALLTEFPSFTKADKSNFVKRNRIIAGLADATIVVESGAKGGALITADLANSYARDVFAFPGRLNDKASVGCNKLIKTNKAALIESVNDLEYLLGWDVIENKKKNVQIELFKQLSLLEKTLYAIIEENNEISIDQICLLSKNPMSKVSAALLSLEFSGFVKCLPGKIYKSNNL